MPKKSKFLIVPYTVLYGGNTFTNNLALNTENAVEVKPPIHFIVTRVTFQVQGSRTATSAVLISDHASNTSLDGLLITNILDSGATLYLPFNTFTFENFAEESINQSFYISNVSALNEEAYVTVIFEGYINE